MWKANGKTTTLLLFLDSLSPKTEKLSLEGTMDLSRDRLILELNTRKPWLKPSKKFARTRRQRRYVLPKRRRISIGLHGIAYQRIVHFIVTAVGT
jgi:hypothetical protein